MGNEGGSEHIAVLLCDTSIEGISERFGDFYDNISDLLKESGTCKYPSKRYQVYSENDDNKLGELSLIYRKLQEGIKDGSVKGIVITGSRSDSFAQDFAWITQLDEFLRSYILNLENFPIVGICFGHQIIAKNLGCKVGRSPSAIGKEYGTTTISLNKDIMNIENSPFRSALQYDEKGTVIDHLNLVEFHQDIVYGLPPPLILEKKKTRILSIGSTNKCSIQGLVTEAGPLKILTFQGHPEFSSDEAIELLKKEFQLGLIDKSLFEKCTYNTTIFNNQGVLIGKAIGNFLSVHYQ